MTKSEFLSKSFTSKAIDEDELKQFVKSAVTYLDDPADLPTAGADNLGDAYNVLGITTVCKEVEAGVYDWVTRDGLGVNLHYPDASGKPTLDGITLNGSLTKTTLGIAPNTAKRTAAADPSGMEILLDDDKKITYDNLEDILAANFGISTLPKYEKQFNPLLTSNGSNVKWEFTHTCKTSEPSVELYDSNGIKQNETILTGLEICHAPSKTLSIGWNTASNVAANSYYVVLIG